MSNIVTSNRSTITITIEEELKQKLETCMEITGLTWEDALEEWVEGSMYRHEQERILNAETIEAIEDEELIGPFYTVEELMQSLLED